MADRRRQVWVPIDRRGHAIDYLVRGNPRIAESALLVDRRSVGDERSVGEYRIVPATLSWSDDG